MRDGPNADSFGEVLGADVADLSETRRRCKSGRVASLIYLCIRSTDLNPNGPTKYAS